MPPIAGHARSAALLTAGIVLLTACGGGEDSSAARSTGADGYPVTLENCGRTVTVDAAPRRAVPVDQGSTEILLSLGLADRLAATATWTDPVMKGLEKANAGVPRISENRPSSEKVLDQEPDFVSASFESTLAKGGVAPASSSRNWASPPTSRPPTAPPRTTARTATGSAPER